MQQHFGQKVLEVNRALAFHLTAIDIPAAVQLTPSSRRGKGGGTFVGDGSLLEIILSKYSE